MSCYETPTRRHCSLFERMENQIRLISKKISAAKDSYHGSSAELQKRHSASYNSSLESALPTVRKKLRSTLGATQPITAERTLEFREKPRQSQELRGGMGGVCSGKIIIGLQKENSTLLHQVGIMQELCESQSYKLGYMRAALSEASQQLALQKEKEMKETWYLTTLLDHYKGKAKKYKQMVKETSSVSIDLGSESNG